MGYEGLYAHSQFCFPHFPFVCVIDPIIKESCWEKGLSAS
jgi:hypothetical protein